MQNIIFTDGSSRGNPGPGGWGVVVVSSRPGLAEVIELGGREDNTTNNRMELTAVINGLANVEADAEYIVFTDSSYLINGITKWVFGWQKNGWKTKTKDDVLNKDLWIALLEKSKNKKVSYKYVGGHVGIVGNERCDVIATSFADNKKIDLYRGPLSNYPVKNIQDVSQNLEKVEDKKTTRSRSNAKAYSYISMVGGAVEKHSTWADCEKRVKGAKGARYKKALNREEEVEIVREFSS
jgi:ribonuclease HI